MSDRLVVEAGHKTVEELLAALHDGRRIVVETEFLGADHEVVLRYDGDTYYCDTPTRLHKHDSAAEMRTCLRNRGYGCPDEPDADDSTAERSGEPGRQDTGRE